MWEKIIHFFSNILGTIFWTFWYVGKNRLCFYIYNWKNKCKYHKVKKKIVNNEKNGNSREKIYIVWKKKQNKANEKKNVFLVNCIKCKLTFFFNL